MLEAVLSISGLSPEVVTYSYIHNLRLSREWVWKLWFCLSWGHVASVSLELGSSDSARWNLTFNGNITSKVISLTDFGDVASKLVMSWVYYTSLKIFWSKTASESNPICTVRMSFKLHVHKCKFPLTSLKFTIVNYTYGTYLNTLR